MKKTILVLANSIKKGGRCVAGIEIINSADRGAKFASYIRPIDATQPEGTLRTSTTMIDNRILQPLDIVEIDFQAYAKDSNHPEDWTINLSSRWKLLGQLPLSALNNTPHNPEDIWGQSNAIEPGFFGSSIQVIKTTEPINVRAYWDNSPWGNRLARKLNLNKHWISITDPIFTQLHGLNDIVAPNLKELQITAGSFIVLSLTPPFTPQNSNTEKQYRVVAAVLEPNA